MQDQLDRSEPFSFAVVTDLHLLKRGMDRTQAAIDQINGSEDLSFVLILGDIIWPGPMGELKALLSTIRASYHVVFGNHDAQRLGEYVCELGPLYGTFEHSGCLFIRVWNAGPAQLAEGGWDDEMGAEQEAWLVRTLQAAQRRVPAYRRILLCAHVPPMPPDGLADPAFRMSPGLSGKFYCWCRQFAVDACFFGHVHYDEVFHRDGTRFITTPSLIWNLDTTNGQNPQRWPKTDRGAYRIVRVYPHRLCEQVRWMD